MVISLNAHTLCQGMSVAAMLGSENSAKGFLMQWSSPGDGSSEVSGGIISSYIRWWRARESFLLYSGCCWLSPTIIVFLTLRSWFRDLWHSHFLVCAVMLLFSSELLLHLVWRTPVSEAVRNDWHECHMWRGRRYAIISMAVILVVKRNHFPGVKDNMEADERGAPDSLFREAWKNNSRVNLSVFWPAKIHAGREKLKPTFSLHECLRMLLMSGMVLYTRIFTKYFTKHFSKCYTRILVNNSTSVFIKHRCTHCLIWYTSSLVNLYVS